MFELLEATAATSTPSKPSMVTIPGHPGDDVPAGALKSIQKGGGIGEKTMSVRYAVIF
jgi:hypothetical protein